MPDAFRLAVGTLTAFRVRPPASLEPPVPGRAMALAPLVGLGPGLVAAAIAAGALRLGASPVVAAVTVVATLALTTRGLHLDGLADTADGLAASYDRSRALEVMHRSDTGPAGLATVVLVLLLQVAALAQDLSPRLEGADGLFWGGLPPRDSLRAVALVPAVAVAARVAIPLACLRGVPSARPEGLGATVAGSVPRPHAAAGLGLAATIGAVGAVLAGFPWWTGLLAVALAALAAAAVVARAVRRLGGITGDVIGAAVETATAAAVLAFCFAA
jgi:adenosylcobinamide-GDP ribazoletransferase